MNDRPAAAGSEPSRGTGLLGPAVPPRDSGDHPRRGVIDGAVGPFLTRAPQSASPAADPLPLTPEIRGADDDMDQGEEIIASGVLGAGEVVPIESLAPGKEEGDREQGRTSSSGFDSSRGYELEREPRLHEQVEAMAEPAGVDVREDDGADAGRADGGEVTSGSEGAGGSVVEGSGEPRPEPGEADVHRAAESAADPGEAMGNSEAAGDDSGVYAGGGAGYGEDPYWEPWVEPSGADAAVGSDDAASAWEAAAAGGEGYAGSAETSSSSDGEVAGATHATPLLDEAIPGASAAVLEEIAERLERIARSLRSRDGDDVGGDASDPLEVLITGYALGYSEGVKSGGGQQRDEV